MVCKREGIAKTSTASKEPKEEKKSVKKYLRAWNAQSFPFNVKDARGRDRERKSKFYRNVFSF